MSRLNALRSLARSDPELYLQAAVECDVLEPAGHLQPEGDAAVWWPKAGAGRAPIWRAGEKLREMLKAKAPPPPHRKGEGSDCPTGKEQYTKVAARAERDVWRARGDTSMRPYFCEHCGLYHLGHGRRADKREGARR